ncbi:MAG: hypothetical protein JRE64_10505 [Deltaproteobacteria bacterium]|nr:hypothetical protein [Deltaproteobacteria bacterium]
MNLLNSLSINELRSDVPHITEIENNVLSIENVGHMLSSEITTRSSGTDMNCQGNQSYYWDTVKKEFHLFLCTDDSKYSDLRKSLQSKGSKSVTVTISTISAALANYVGVVAGVMVPMIALCLYAALKIGLYAYCNLLGNLK